MPQSAKSCGHHHVYVIELSKDGLLKPKFVRCYPGYAQGKRFVYGGLTGLDPYIRF